MVNRSIIIFQSNKFFRLELTQITKYMLLDTFRTITSIPILQIELTVAPIVMASSYAK